ncbi:hypothetical protein HanRHA438_Chr02g0056691 [Helianthus annuus]|nr:hypothetical protein HanRHA438_Chr02g0056691 [Helianthus annuus]
MNSLNFMLTFSHVLSQVAFLKLRNGWNRRTHGIRVLSGVHCLEVLAFCFRCAMKIPVQSRHALIFRGVTDWYQSYRFQRIRFL